MSFYSTIEHVAQEAPSGPDTAQLAVIMPAFNEIAGIERTVSLVREALANVAYRTEVIVVDDGSDDGTAARAAAAGARVISHSSNLGYGAALRTGILDTRAPAIAIIDADCSYHPDAIPRLYAKLNHADMVVGSRRLSSPGVSWSRRPWKWILNRFASYLVGHDVPDLNSGQRVMRRDVVLRYLHLLPQGFSFTSTITLALLAHGYRVVFEPIEYVPRAGRSKLRPSNFGGFLFLVVRSVVLFNPLKVFLPLGALVFTVGLLKLVQDLIRWQLSETAVMCFLAALVIWAVGLLGDMISRLHMQPPWRP
jgi:glycosyltransferase involved in cell wall biosynthesis